MENKDWQEGLDLSKKREWDAALVALEKAMEVIQDNPDLIHDRAVAMFNLGQKKEALAELDKALALQPDYSYRYSSRAYMRNACKDITGAIDDYRKAIELDPEDAIALNNLGLLEEQLGYRKEADERFKAADELMGILKDRGIDLSKAPAPEDSKTEPAPAQEIPANVTETEEESGSVWSELKSVFTSSKSRKEFVTFLRNGFTLKDKNPDKK